MGTTTVKFCKGTHVRKHTTSPLQTKYHHITCRTLQILLLSIHCFPPWYLYLVVVEWLACLNDPESYAGGGIAARRVTHSGQVKGDKPDKKSTLVERVTIFHCKYTTVKKYGHGFHWNRLYRG